MIKIRMYENNWQILLSDEIWEFENLKEMQKNLDLILNIKDKYGKLK